MLIFQILTGVIHISFSCLFIILIVTLIMIRDTKTTDTALILLGPAGLCFMSASFALNIPRKRRMLTPIMDNPLTSATHCQPTALLVTCVMLLPALGFMCFSVFFFGQLDFDQHTGSVWVIGGMMTIVNLQGFLEKCSLGFIVWRVWSVFSSLGQDLIEIESQVKDRKQHPTQGSSLHVDRIRRTHSAACHLIQDATHCYELEFPGVLTADFIMLLLSTYFGMKMVLGRDTYMASIWMGCGILSLAGLCPLVRTCHLAVREVSKLHSSLYRLLNNNFVTKEETLQVLDV
ncbi:uncharacterized protein LOC127750387 [Frankliniella occidentalis]|uniref:Uncharacterized protein LOC127750387 n=1 Tax=Frankliniella occidentalis TaxID=133901 RepID=A0A9C6X2K2_FRAOC|nr:uncharacterized protein LOC127750387 [Frankliniella occidentalis]